MRRAGKIALAAAAVVIALLLLVIGAGNSGPGRLLVERLVPTVTGGTVSVAGLSGRFPDRLRIDQVTVSDARGPWLTVERARIDWSPLSLFRGEVAVETMTAVRAAVKRLPETAAGQTSGLPLRLAVDNLRVDRLELAASIAGSGGALRLNGRLHLASPEEGEVALDAASLDGAGTYKLDAMLTPAAMAARVEAAEPAGGLLSRLVGLPTVGPLSLSASLDGPRRAEQARLSLSAGAFSAHGRGTIDLDPGNLDGRDVDVDFVAAAPAMAPRPNLSWQSLQVEMHLHGKLTHPRAEGHLAVVGLRTGGAGIGRLDADIAGDSGTIGLTAALAALRLPGLPPDLFAAAPVELQAKASLDTPHRSVSFTLSHPRLSLSGEAAAGPAPTVTITATLPALAPFADAAGLDLKGHATLTAKLTRQQATTRFAVDGTLGVSGGLPAAVALVGDDATLSLAGSLRGTDIAIDNATLRGTSLLASVEGARRDGIVDLRWRATLSELSPLVAGLSGSLSAVGQVRGALDDFAATARATGSLAPPGLPEAPLTLSLRAQGLPALPAGEVTVAGQLVGAPLDLAVAASRQPDGALEFSLDRLRWKSASGQGRLTLAPHASMPLGQVQLRIARLDDLAPLIGRDIAGSLDGTLAATQTRAGPEARLQAHLQQLALGGSAVKRLTVEARISDPQTHPRLAAAIDAEDFRQGPMIGSARVTADGPLDALALHLSAQAKASEGPVQLVAEGALAAARRHLQLMAMRAEYGGAVARLTAPAGISFADGLAVDALRLAIGGGDITLAGRLMPALAVRLAGHGITAAVAKPLLPGVELTGTIGFEGELRGKPAAPEGTLHLTGRHLRLTSGIAAGLPPAEVDASATLAAGAARLDARLNAGAAVHLRLAGTAPLQPSQALALRLSGGADLKALDPLLTPAGRAARGQLTLDLGVGGTIAAPRATGTVRLAHGSLQDFVQGVHITDAQGLLTVDGDTLRLSQFSGHAGGGNMSAAGTIGVLRPDLPVSLTLTARHARPLASDLLSATLDADLTLQGELAGGLRLGGKIQVSRADINIPDSLPRTVAVLELRRPGSHPAALPPHRAVGL
ncbi:MAG: translocation/assembly module TamB domain-containing protein, partial [Thiohalocapsa sp.]